MKRESPNKSLVLNKALKKSGRHINDINAEAAKEILCMIFNFYPKVACVVLGIFRDWEALFQLPKHLYHLIPF